MIGNGCSGYRCRSYSNSDCDAWNIRCASGSVPHLDFQTMDTERGWDYVYVYDGNNFVRSDARRFSGSTHPSDQQASGRDMIVRKPGVKTNGPGDVAPFAFKLVLRIQPVMNRR